VLKMYDFLISAACSAPLLSKLEKQNKLFLSIVVGQFVASSCDQCMPWKEPWLMPAEEMCDWDTNIVMPLGVYANNCVSLLVV